MRLSQAEARRFADELKRRGKLAMDTDVADIADMLHRMESDRWLEGDRYRARDLESNAGMPPWLSEHPDDEDACFDTREEEEEDDAADRRARDARQRLGKDETEEEAERREEEEEGEADDALREAEDARREAEDASKSAEDRKRAEDRRRRAEDRLRRMGDAAVKRAHDRRRKAEDLRRARDGETDPDMFKPDTSHTLDEDRRRARDRRRLGRDYRRARDAHRRARDTWRRHAEDYRRAHDARREAEDRRKEAEDAKRTDDVKRAEDAMHEAEDRMRRAAEDARRAEDAMRHARDARRSARDRRRADDQPPEFKGMPKPGGEMVTKAAMDAAIQSALRDSDYKHRAIMDALEIVRPKVGKIALDSGIRDEADVYARALDVLGVPHAGITQLGALKQIFSMAQKPGSSGNTNGFAMDTAPKVGDYQTFTKMFPGAASIERT